MSRMSNTRLPATSSTTSSNRPGLDYAIARGDKGKTFFLRCLHDRARQGGRFVKLYDGDPGNRTLATSMAIFNEPIPVEEPIDRSVEERDRFLKRAVTDSATQRVLVDPGASDRSAMSLNGASISDEAEAAFAKEWGGEIVEDFDLFASVANMNVYFFTGGDPSDMTLMQELLESPLAKKKLIIILNEGVQRYDWEEVRGLKIYKRALDHGAEEFLFPKCGAGVAMRALWGGRTFREAIVGEPLKHPRTGEWAPLSIDERQALRSFCSLFSLRIEKSGMESLLP